MEKTPRCVVVASVVNIAAEAHDIKKFIEP
jgi:hypothetical protein